MRELIRKFLASIVQVDGEDYNAIKVRCVTGAEDAINCQNTHLRDIDSPIVQEIFSIENGVMYLNVDFSECDFPSGDTLCPDAYVWESKTLYFDNLQGQNQFIVPSQTLDATAVVESVKVSTNGNTLPPSSFVTAGIGAAGNGFSYTINGTDIEVTTDNDIGSAGQVSWVLVEWSVRKSLPQINNC